MPEAAQRYRCEDEAREALLAAARELAAAGSPGAASLSLRWPRSGGDGMLTVGAPVAPAATVDAVAWVALDARRDATARSDPRLPTDWQLHRELLGRRSGLEAIVRCRPVFCMTLACSPGLREAGIPAYADGTAAEAGRIRCAPPAVPDAAALAAPATFATFATFAGLVDDALGDRAACLLAGAGLLAVGATLDAMLATVANVETLAQVAWRLRQAEQREADGVAA